jgi:hypothetical protein
MRQAGMRRCAMRRNAEHGAKRNGQARNARVAPPARERRLLGRLQARDQAAGARVDAGQHELHARIRKSSGRKVCSGTSRITGR